GHGRALAQGSAEGARVALQGGDELGPGHVRVRILRLVVQRQPIRPVGREQRERVPALAAPSLADRAALDHDVVVSGIREEATEGEPGLPGADDERVDRGHGPKGTPRRSRPGCEAVAVRGATRRAALPRGYRALPRPW